MLSSRPGPVLYFWERSPSCLKEKFQQAHGLLECFSFTKWPIPAEARLDLKQHCKAVNVGISQQSHTLEGIVHLHVHHARMDDESAAERGAELGIRKEKGFLPAPQVKIYK